MNYFTLANIVVCSVDALFVTGNIDVLQNCPINKANRELNLLDQLTFF
jgi:hypothetical protein